MIKLQVQFNRLLCPPKMGPVKGLQTQINHGGIQTPQRILEAKLLSFRACQGLSLRQNLIKQGLIELPRTMGIGISQRRSLRSRFHPQMSHFSQGRCQTTANLPQRMCRPHLAKKHRDKLIPTTKPFDPFFRLMLLDCHHKIFAIYQIQDLPKTTTCVYHCVTPVCWLSGSSKPYDLFSTILTQTGAFPTRFKNYFGQECNGMMISKR
jgi:hypothetical protein